MRWLGSDVGPPGVNPPRTRQAVLYEQLAANAAYAALIAFVTAGVLVFTR